MSLSLSQQRARLGEKIKLALPVLNVDPRLELDISLLAHRIQPEHTEQELRVARNAARWCLNNGNRLSKEQVARYVKAALGQTTQTSAELARHICVTESLWLTPKRVQGGIGWLRDNDPDCLVTVKDGRRQSYKLADTSAEVREHTGTQFRGTTTTIRRSHKVVFNFQQSAPDGAPELDMPELELRHLRERFELLNGTI